MADVNNTQARTAALLADRLRAAPAEVRAIATAETVDWLPPSFDVGPGQAEAVHPLLCACDDARRTAFGPPATTAAPRRLVPSERLLALDRAIVAGSRSLRMLHQRGIRATVTTSERTDFVDEKALARAVLIFRRRAIGPRVAR